MAVPKFDEKEMRVVYQRKSIFTTTNVYDYPCTIREASDSLYRKKEPVWQFTGSEYKVFTPRINPDNIARGMVFDALPFNAETEGGGKDMFGVEWEYIKQVRGSMVRPGNPMLEDMNDWEDVLVWPDIDSWDWKGSAEYNKPFFDTDQDIKGWLQNGYFERIISLMEFEGAIMALCDEDQKDAVHAFLSKLSDLYIDFFDHMCCYYPQIEVFYIHDDWGAQKDTFFSPELVREMIVPYMRKVNDFIHSKGRFADFHSCGKIEKQVPNVIAAGWDSWAGQPMNDTAKLYEKYGDQIIIGVYPEYEAAGSTEEQQRQAARDYAARFCRRDKPCITPGMAFDKLTPAFLEELYRQSRIAFSE